MIRRGLAGLAILAPLILTLWFLWQDVSIVLQLWRTVGPALTVGFAVGVLVFGAISLRVLGRLWERIPIVSLFVPLAREVGRLTEAPADLKLSRAVYVRGLRVLGIRTRADGPVLIPPANLLTGWLVWGPTEPVPITPEDVLKITGSFGILGPDPDPTTPPTDQRVMQTDRRSW